MKVLFKVKQKVYKLLFTNQKVIIKIANDNQQLFFNKSGNFNLFDVE